MCRLRIALSQRRIVFAHIKRVAGEVSLLDRPRGKNRIARRVEAFLWERGWAFNREIRVAKEYDLFFAFCLNPHDLRYLKHIKGLHGQCRRSVCVIGELWPSRIAEYRADLEALRSFDQIFSNLHSSVDLIAKATGRPCHFLPLGIDALRFCPVPDNPARTIDVYSIGRRAQDEHRALLASAERGKMLYVYDTVADFDVVDTREHRVLLANLITPRWTGQNRPFVDTSKPAISGERARGRLSSIARCPQTANRCGPWCASSVVRISAHARDAAGDRGVR